MGVIKEVILRHAVPAGFGRGRQAVHIPVEDAIRIRTGEEGETVLQAHEGEEVGVAAPEGARRGTGSWPAKA